MSFCNCKGVLKPVCIPATAYEPSEITCPNISTSEVTSPLCDFIPEIKSIPDLFVNLPFFLLFLVSLPARFLYCMAYSFLVNADTFIERLFYYIIYPAIDLITSPFIYFVLGFNNGLHDQFNLPNKLYGFLNACIVNSILETIYRGIGDAFYSIGFAIGFIISILVRLINFVIDLNCYIAYLTIQFGLSYCINLGIHTFSNCVTFSVQPFSFLQQFVCRFLNCGCALGQPPTLGITIPIAINCPTPTCGGGSVVPPCMIENLEYPFATSEYPTITMTSETPYSVNDLTNCFACIDNVAECNVCYKALEYISENHVPYSCNEVNGLIADACPRCYDTGEAQACFICNNLLNTCNLNILNGSELSCYSEYVDSCDSCYAGYNSYCTTCQEYINICKLANAMNNG